MSNNQNDLLKNGKLWLGLARDSGKLILSFALGAATYFGQPLHPFFRQHWLTIALAFALAMAVQMLVKRERVRSLSRHLEGIVAAWPLREMLDQNLVFSAVKGARRINILGYNLRSPYLSHGGTFDDLIREKLKMDKTVRVRVLIADPDSEGLARRAETEDKHQNDRMRNDGNSSLEYLSELLRSFPGGELEVRLLDGELIRSSCIFADESLFVTWYLSRRTGNKCPTFKIFGKGSRFFLTFEREFDALWADGQPYSPP